MLKTTTNAEFHIKVHLLGNTGELRRHRKTAKSQNNIRKLNPERVQGCLYTGKEQQDTENYL